MKKFLLSAAMAAATLCPLSAQVANYALSLEPNGTVDCGTLPELDAREQYVIQFWMNPAEWTEGATILSRGDGFKVTMATEGTLLFTVGQKSWQATDIPTGEWSFVSLRRSESGNTFINGKRKQGSLDAFPTGGTTDKLIIGGGYNGKIDEIRVWGADITDKFNYFEHTTLNRWNANWDDLIAYYKMDDEQCDNLVDYKSLYTTGRHFNHHGIFSAEGTSIVKADNPNLPYLINSAYTANERFYDRAVTRDQYLLANDLIILGVESLSDGHVRTCTPNNHAVINGAEWLPEFEGHKGVMSFDGKGTLDCGTDIMRAGASAITFESWVYVEKWVPGAYLFRKETADGSKGFSIRLGEESNHEVVVRVNGNNFYNQRQMKAGEWIHLSIGVEGGTTPGKTFFWVYNGTKVGNGSSKCDNSTVWRPEGNSDCHGIIGEGFIGKIDEFAIWDGPVNRADFAGHMTNGLPMPGIGKSVTSDQLQRANTYLRFDDQQNPGWSSHSQDEWKRIMESAYEGHRGYQIRISVKSHNGWESTIANAEKRKIFAADLAEIAKNYDGVELDLEWIYGEQTDLGLLSDEIRKALPAGKTLMISCHNVAYRFPLKKMENCDGFTFQQYGPQKDHSYYSHFKSMAKTFVNYGFPKDKILLSYATTTSRGYINGSMASPIMGVKDGFMEDGFEPDGEIDSGVSGNETFYFDGPLQTYKRAKYVTDNRLAGIFYWDMGNDCRPDHPYSLAKWCGWGLNANVDSLVTSVEVRHPESVSLDDITGVCDNGRLSCTVDGNTLVIGGVTDAMSVTVTSLDGRQQSACVMRDGKVDIAALAGGHYIATVVTADGKRMSGRFVKQ